MTVEALPFSSAPSHRARGIALFEQGEWKQALRSLDYALDADPADMTALNLRARSFEALGQYEDALRSVDRCLDLEPANVADRRNRGLLLTKLGYPEEALASFDAVLTLDSRHVDVLVKRAFLLHQLERRHEALESAQRAVDAAPDDLNALNTRGMILETLSRYEEALVDFERVLAINPHFADAINNRGMIHARNGQFEQALDCYERSLALNPEQPQARYNQAVVRLALGDWERGFREFECRWNIAPLEAARFSRLSPVWTGKESLAGKTVILHHEQGYGDTIQFSRYAPLVQRLGARVIVAVPAGLQSLMRSLPGNAQVLSEGDPVPPHDYCCPFMSLPGVFGTTPNTVSADIPYLSADPDRTRYWASRLGLKRRTRIGLVWSGRRQPPINYARDMDLESLLPLLELPADFVCLQPEMSEQDRSLLATLPQIVDWGGELSDFGETAALIMNLDLVISVDSAVAHLAGALGRPVWIMNRFASCWRWLQKRADSPWYPTLRLFRQASVGDWTGVVQDVCRAAAQIIGVAPIPASAIAATPSASDDYAQLLARTLSRAQTDHRDGRLAEAAESYQSVLALDPNQPEALHYLGVVLAQTGRCEEALLPLARAVELQPHNAAAHNHFGNALAGVLRLKEALSCYERSIALSPRFDDAHYNRGVVLDKLGERHAALASYDQALAINPAYSAAHNNRGNALLELGRREDALASYERAVTLRPDYAEAWVNRANVLRYLHRYEQALNSCERALGIDPNQAEAHGSRGAVLANLGRDEEALAAYQRAVTLNPVLADGLWNKALLHLSRGEFNEGWPLYEARWQVRSLGLSHRLGAQPPWLGQESLANKIVLLHAEQGYGDTIQFCRYAPLLAAQGARVILGVPSALKTLMGSLQGVDEVVAQGDLPQYDYHCPLLSLPFALGTSLDTIPASIPYLGSDPSKQAIWSKRLGKRRSPRIGLVWAGKPTHSNDLNRSIAFETLSPLLHARAHWVSLQKEIRESDRATLAEHPRFMNLGEELRDFADAAALIAALDLVITVDTSLAHLAGALGKPVWILLPHVADWRWLQSRDDSPWYPTARLFRQNKAREWADVVERVNSSLKGFLRQHSKKVSAV